LATLYVFRSWQPWLGFQFWLFVVLYGLSRLLLEPLRAMPYVIGDGYLGMQLLALAAIVVALAVMATNFSGDSEKSQATGQ
jgi:prolipoprotein diacylglyceryltransferase